MNFKTTLVAITILSLSIVSGARAGPYGNDLGRCLIDSTSQADRNVLILWMFSAASNHPVVRDIVNVSSAQLDSANKNFAELTVKLLTEDCRTAAKKAIQFEGVSAISGSFKLFGEVAGKELFTSPEVAGALAGFEQHLDAAKLQELNP